MNPVSFLIASLIPRFLATYLLPIYLKTRLRRGTTRSVSFLHIAHRHPLLHFSQQRSSLSSSHQRFFRILTQELQQAVHKRYSPASKDHITFFFRSFTLSEQEGINEIQILNRITIISPVSYLKLRSVSV